MPRSKKTTESGRPQKSVEAKKQQPDGKQGPKADIAPGETQHRFRVQFDVGYRGTKGKVMSQEQNTVPDMSLTVRQLVENHTRGHDSNVHVQKPLYFDMEIPVFRDLTDAEAYKKHLESQIQSINGQIEDERNQAAKDAAAAKANNESRNEKAQTSNASTTGEERIPDA